MSAILIIQDIAILQGNQGCHSKRGGRVAIWRRYRGDWRSMSDKKLGEVVTASVRVVDPASRSADEEVMQCVGSTLGKHKVPQHVFWFGDGGVGNDYPKTGSGKQQKHILRDIDKTEGEVDGCQHVEAIMHRAHAT